MESGTELLTPKRKKLSRVLEDVASGFRYAASRPAFLAGSDKGKLSCPQCPVGVGVALGNCVVSLWHCVLQPRLRGPEEGI